MAKPLIFFSNWPWVILVVVMLSGCGSGPRLTQVSGVVTLDGAPLADASICLIPTEEGPIANANSDAQGHFVLMTSNRPGVTPGQYRATVSKTELQGVDPQQVGVYTNITEKWITPQRYGQVETSGLEYDISAANRDFRIELTSAE